MLEQVTDLLLAGWTGGLLDLRGQAVVVPTGQAGRRLLASLGQRAMRDGTGLLPPLVITPEVLLEWAGPGVAPAASALEAQLAWARVLVETNLTEFAQVFPRTPTVQDYGWATVVAEVFLKLQRTLGDAGLDFAQTAQCLGADHKEASRWAELAALEKRYFAGLRKAGRADPESARRWAAAKVALPQDVKSLLVAGVPDPNPLALVALQTLAAAGVRVEVAVFAPDSLAEEFDAWGRPLTDKWINRTVPFSDPARQIMLKTNPQAQAESMVAQLMKSPHGAAVGVADPALLAPLSAELDRHDLVAFDPEGLPMARHVISWLLTSLVDLLGEQNWSAFSRMLRLPSLHETLAREVQESKKLPEVPNLLECADALQNYSLPQTLPAAIRAARTLMKQEQERDVMRDQFGILLVAMERMQGWLGRFDREPLEGVLREFLQFAFRHQMLLPGSEGAQQFEQAAAALRSALTEFSTAAAHFAPELDASMRLPLLLRMLEKTRLFGETGDALRVVLLGWLELPWEPSAEMIIGGMNEGLVPESISSDAWLPHHERANLGLRTNEDRLARDAFLLTSLLESRQGPAAGMMVFAGRVSADNEPLKPSRLLVQCPLEELPGRVAMLFPKETEESEDKPTPAWNLAWKLKLPPLNPANTGAIIRKIGVTQLRAWLDCPFRYYLRYVLKMEKLETAMDELDARAFGDLCHHALMQMAKDPAINTSANAQEITDYLHEAVNSYFASRYGQELSVPLIIQRETARSRLTAAAEIHARSRADGWQVFCAEKRIEEILGEKWIIDDVEIRGQIDLIEQNERTGNWRILDYKTASKPKSPEDAHLKVIGSRSKREDPEWVVWRNDAGKPARWIDLQLPLYALALQRKFGKLGAAAYLNLPAALGSSEISNWAAISDEKLLQSAESCAREVIRKIADGVFWPPVEKPAYDDYKHLFFNTPLESVDFSEMQDYRLALEAR